MADATVSSARGYSLTLVVVTAIGAAALGGQFWALAIHIAEERERSRWHGEVEARNLVHSEWQAITADLSSKVSGLAEQERQLRDSHADSRVRMEADLELLRERKAALAEEVQRAAASFEARVAATKELEARIRVLEAERDSALAVKREAIAASIDVAALQSQMVSLGARRQAAMADLETVEASVRARESALAALNRSRTSAEAGLSRIEATLAELRTSEASLSSSVASLTVAKERADKQLKEQLDRASRARAEADVSVAQKTGADRDIALLTGRSQALQDEVTRLTTELGRKQTEIAEAEARLQRARNGGR